MTDDELDQSLRASILSEHMDTAQLERSIREKIKRPFLPRWALATAAGIALAITGGLAYRSLFKPPPLICVAAARDHNHEIVNGAPREWLSEPAAIQSLAAQQGVPSAALAALGTTGYRLEGGRLCFLNKQIFLHLAYSKDDLELSVYLRPRGSQSPVDGSIHEASIDTEDLAYFQTAGLTAVFVAEHSRAEALAFARAAARVL
jgi:anti-sigma factor RsiW